MKTLALTLLVAMGLLAVSGCHWHHRRHRHHSHSFNAPPSADPGEGITRA
jgi:hypothetical protein